MPENKRYNRYIGSKEWKKKREMAFAHYGRRCSLCGTTRRLRVHHIHYRNFEREDVRDLTVLCEKHHDKFEREKRRKKKQDNGTARGLLLKEIIKTGNQLKTANEYDRVYLIGYLRRLKKELKSTA